MGEEVEGVGLNVCGASRVGDSPLPHDLSTQSPGIRTDVDDVVGCTDDFLVVLYDHDRIANIAQLFQYPDEPLGVATMESDAWFVQDIQATYEATAQAGSKVDALAFSA